MRSKRLVVWAVAVCLMNVMAVRGQQRNQVSGTTNAAARGVAAEPDSPAAQPQLATSAQTGANAPTVVPRLIKFNGTLRDLAGKPIAGPVDVTFSLYTDEAGGSPLWFETQTVQASSLGRYTVLLGAMTPAGVPMELFAACEARWLGVQVGNLPEQPRVLLVSVPYAMKAGDAETLGGKPASAFMMAGSSTATNPTLSGLVQASALTSPLGRTTPQVVTTTLNYIPVFADNAGTVTNSAMIQSGGKIGVGTTPTYGFDVNSNVFAIGTKTALAGAGGTMRFRDDTGTVRWAFGLPGSAGATDFFLANAVNGHAPFYIQGGASSYALYLHASGNVGILTNTPSFPLDVNGNVIGVGTKTAKAGYGGTLRFRDDTGTPRWLLGFAGSAGATAFNISDLVNSRTPLVVEAGTLSTTLYLKSSGNVGIGTAAPGQKLSVAGVVESTSGGFKFPDGTTQTTASTGGTATDLNCVGCVSSSEVDFNYAGSSSKGGAATSATTAATATNALALGGVAPSGYATLGANAFTGAQSIAGSVGIGTTAPDATLHVLTSGTTKSTFVLAGDAIGGECSVASCAGIDAISRGTNGFGLYAAVTDPSGFAAWLDGDIRVGGDIYDTVKGLGLIVTSPDGSKCARIGIDNTGALSVTAVTCLVRRTLRRQ